MVGERPFPRRVELESGLIPLRNEVRGFAVVLVYLAETIEETRPRRLDVLGRLGAGREFEAPEPS